MRAEIVKHGDDGAQTGEQTSVAENKLKQAEAEEKKKTCNIFW